MCLLPFRILSYITVVSIVNCFEDAKEDEAQGTIEIWERKENASLDVYISAMEHRHDIGLRVRLGELISSTAYF